MAESSAKAERTLRAIARTLTQATGTDFARYRIATMRRRFEKRTSTS